MNTEVSQKVINKYYLNGHVNSKTKKINNVSITILKNSENIIVFTVSSMITGVQLYEKYING